MGIRQHGRIYFGNPDKLDWLGPDSAGTGLELRHRDTVVATVSAAGVLGVPTLNPTTLQIGGTAVSATAAELNYLDLAALGTGAVSKAVVLSATGTYVGPTSAASKWTWSVTSDSTDAGTSVEPFVHNTTMTGIGGVGGRARFELDTNVALGGWANALKAQLELGAAGKVTGLGSAFVAETILSAGAVDGSYAGIEIELGMPANAVTGTRTSLMSLNAYGAAVGVFDDNGYLFDLNGVTAGAAHLFRTGLSQAVTASGNLRVLIGGTPYYIPLCAASALTS